MTSSNLSGGSSPSGGAGFCAACGAAISAGARFCHRCGTPVGQGLPLTRTPAPSGGAAAVLPWGVAFVALLALVAMVAGKNFGAAKGSGIDGSANSLPTQAVDGASAAPFAQGGGELWIVDAATGNARKVDGVHLQNVTSLLEWANDDTGLFAALVVDRMLAGV